MLEQEESPFVLPPRDNQHKPEAATTREHREKPDIKVDSRTERKPATTANAERQIHTSLKALSRSRSHSRETKETPTLEVHPYSLIHTYLKPPAKAD